jgi:hypothetical protein
LSIKSNSANYLENYSITTDREEELFFSHVKCLVKKKLLMQIRDKKTMAIDTIFPIILILIGLWLATLSIYHDGAPRTVCPEAIYPPTTIYYNE